MKPIAVFSTKDTFARDAILENPCSQEQEEISSKDTAVEVAEDPGGEEKAEEQKEADASGKEEEEARVRSNSVGSVVDLGMYESVELQELAARGWFFYPFWFCFELVFYCLYLFLFWLVAKESMDGFSSPCPPRLSCTV